MARPRKTGLDYFPFECDFFADPRMVAIAGEFGIKGEIVAVKLLCEIFHQGYFVEWSDLLRFKLAHLCPGISAELVGQIVDRLVLWGIFDKSLFDSAKVLTSSDIQRDYFDAVKFRVPKSELPYLLIAPRKSYAGAANPSENVSQTETQVSQWKTRDSQWEMPQIRLDKNKRNASQERGKKNVAESSVCPAPTEEDVLEYFKQDQLRGSASLFFNYYQSRGWRTDGAPIHDWKALAKTWSERDKSLNKTKAPSPMPKTEYGILQEAEARRKAEREMEAAANPRGLTSAQILAEAKVRMGLNPSEPVTSAIKTERFPMGNT